jgi:hypothetical protein
LGFVFVLVVVLGCVGFGFWVFCKGFIGDLLVVFVWGVFLMGADEVVDVGKVAGAGGVGGLSAEGLLLMAAENLKRSIEFTVRQLNAKKVRGEMKLKWSRSLTRQVEALVKVAEALDKIGSKSAVEVDLATYLSAVESRVPRRYVTKKFARIARRMQVNVSRRELVGFKRRST